LFVRLILLLPLLTLAGCASLGTQRLADRLAISMLEQNDPETVRMGAPAYLLLADSLIADNPDDDSLLVAGSELYGAYAGALVEDPERRRRLTSRALAYAERALCDEITALCAARDGPLEPFEEALAQVSPGDLPALYALGTSWVGWIESHAEDWNAVAQIPKAERVFRRVLELNPGYRDGRTQLYLAALLTLSPAASQDQLTEARQHFESAIALSQGRDLVVLVEYARRYARRTLDRPLHDRLLQQALDTDPIAPRLTLGNVLAQEEARRLLADGFFMDRDDSAPEG